MDNISWPQLSAMFAICVGMFVILNIIKGWWGRKDDATAPAPAPKEPVVVHDPNPSQSVACGLQHAAMTELFRAQNNNIAELLKQNGTMIVAYKESSHASELRHQIVLGELRLISMQLAAGRGGPNPLMTGIQQSAPPPQMPGGY